MHNVCQRLGWLVQQLRNAGLKVLDEADGNAVQTGHCEPWVNMGCNDLDWTLQGDYNAKKVLLLNSDGTMLTALPVHLDEGPMLSEIRAIIERHLGRALCAPPAPGVVFKTMNAELRASKLANKLINSMKARQE